MQSCVAYQKTSVSLDQAHNRGKVKLVGESGQVYKFTNIELRDSVYYGFGREYISQSVFTTPPGAKTPIDSTAIEAIYLKSKKKSTTQTLILIFALPAAYIFTAVVVNLFGIW